MRVYASNINIDILKGRKEKSNYCLDYNQYFFAMLDENSLLYKKDIKEVVFFIDIDEFFHKELYILPSQDLILQMKKRIDEFFSVFEKFVKANEDKIIIINNVEIKKNLWLNFLNFNFSPNFIEVENYFNESLLKIKLNFNNVLILDWKKIVYKYGVENLVNEKFWYLGRIKYTNLAFKQIEKEVNSLINAYRGNIKKVLVLDLDNTLWGGILGEDGIGGVKISEDGEGKIYRDFQRNIKALQQLGVLLAINSKNNFDDVKEMFEKNSMMILNWDDFIIKQINWNNKVENIKEIAKELNLGLDSIVFIDDNPVERDIVRENLPEVNVPEFPNDITNLNKWFIEEVIEKYFCKVSLTREDLKKQEQYKANFKRKEIEKKSVNIEEFIKNLNIKLKIYKNSLTYLARTAQMTQKTNQFNLTTKRYTESDMKRMIEDVNYDVFVLEYEDKFQNEGIIGEVILKYEGEKAIVDTFLLSCRVIGRNVEYTFLERILDYLNKKGIKYITFEYIPTKKNKIVAKNFYNKVNIVNNENEFTIEIEKLQNYLKKMNLIEGVEIE